MTSAKNEEIDECETLFLFFTHSMITLAQLRKS